MTFTEGMTPQPEQVLEAALAEFETENRGMLRDMEGWDSGRFPEMGEIGVLPAWEQVKALIQQQRNELTRLKAAAEEQATDSEQLAREVHAAWRDGMLIQKREVSSVRMKWETLSEDDHQLDLYIAARLFLACTGRALSIPVGTYATTKQEAQDAD